jgi:hypothetical protein
MRTPLLVASLLLVGSSPAFAHRLLSTPRIVGDQLRVEAYYSDDTPAQEAKVTVSLGDEVVAEGRTDEKGVWMGPRPKPGTYTVRVTSTGHAADPETLVVPEEEEVVAVPPPDERERRTRTPWARLVAGLGIIGGLGIAWLLARRATNRASGPESAA